ncbi:MAG TPA: tandem-95 repeat protein, partial [Tepidisphaeraceae bacterium]|nr:tandem-95 repeat protein [Tepidisphaeraceae bacterium]
MQKPRPDRQREDARHARPAAAAHAAAAGALTAGASARSAHAPAAAAAAADRLAQQLVEHLESRRMMSAAPAAAEGSDVALIDSSLPNFNQLSAAVAGRSEVIAYDGRRDTAERVLGKIVAWAAATRTKINSLSILSHGSAGRFALGREFITVANDNDPAWAKLRKVLSKNADIYVFGCDVASSSKGIDLLNHLAATTGADVYGSTNLTGGKRGDWVLEAASKGADDAYAAPLSAKAMSSWDFSLAAGITVTPTTPTATTEAGGTASFNVVLDEAPTDDVTVPIVSTDTTEGTVSAASITFTAANWNVPQAVTVTGASDSVDDGDVAYDVKTGPAVSTDANYNGLSGADLSLTNTDDDTAGFTVTPTSGLTTTEAGASASFDVVLTSAPLADVTISVTSDDASEGTVSVATLTFTAANWNVAQTVTVTGANDAVDDGNVAYNVVLGAAASGDAGYNGITPSAVAISNTDDDTAGITVAPTTGLTTTEAGGSASFSVVLTSQPTADVTISITSGDTSEGTASVATLTFTPANWNAAQTVTITGQDDLTDDGNVAYSIVTGAAASADAAYAGFNVADVTLSNTDNDTAGITVTPTSGLVTTEAGVTASFDVVLTSQPTADVVVAVATNDATEGTVSAATLTFTAANWNVPQTITVTGQNDAAQDGNIAYTVAVGPATSGDATYNGMDAADVSLSNTDNDAAGITVTPTMGLVTTEAGGTATFNVVLNSQPVADVTIAIGSSSTGEGTVSAASLTFTAGNWNVPQTVTITGANDSKDDGDASYQVTTGAAASADPLYAGMNPADVSVTNIDNDTAGVTVTPTSGLVTTEAGGTATFNVVLNSQPSGQVHIDLASSNTAEGTIGVATLTFKSNDWNVPQTVTITGVNDAVDDGDVAYSIVTANATAGDALYGGMAVADVAVTNLDNDTASVSVSPTSGLVTTEAGAAQTFSVVLTSQPTANVMVGLASSDTTEGTVSASSLTFTSANWNVAQVVTVTGAGDFIDDGNIAYSVVTAAAVSTDVNYGGMPVADVSLSNTDDDTAGVSVSAASSTTTSEAGGTSSFNVVLTSQPSADVVIPIASSNALEGTVSTSSLTFTAANWNVAQTVTVTGANDFVDDGDIGYQVTTGDAASADPGYSGMAVADVALTNLDNDAAGIIVTPTSGLVTTEAGGQASFNVRLNSQPTGDVTIGITSGNTAEGTLSTTLLTFTAANWNVDQTVTVTGVNEQVDDGNQLYTISTAPAVSSDPSYNNLDAANVTITNTDDDTAGITVTPTSGLVTTEAGGSATFDVVLTSQPTGDVFIPLSSSNGGEGTISVAGLTFTAGNWNVPQTVTVTGADDAVDDNNVAYSIVTGAAVSADGVYGGMNAADVSLSNTDNDAAGITVSPTGGLATTEAGSEVTFDIVLTSQPLMNVTINLSSADLTEGTLSASSVTFTPANWNVPQTITVSSVDDALVDGTIAYTVITAPAVSSDPAYNNLNPANVSVTNADNDPNGSPLGGEFRPNQTTANNQQTFAESPGAVASDAHGNYVVTWSSYNQDAPATWGVYAQRYDRGGNKLGGEFRVSTATASEQQYSRVAVAPEGDFVIAWASASQDGSGWGVYVQKYTAAGLPVGAETRVNTTTGGDQAFPAVGIDAAGNFTVAWTAGSNQDGSGQGIYQRQFDAAGNPLAGEQRVNTTTGGDQNQPALAMNPDGNYVVVWHDSGDVYAQRYNAAGAKQGAQFRANVETFKEQDHPHVAIDYAGNFVITWSSTHQDSGGNKYGVFAQRFTAAGAAVGLEIQANSATSGNQQYSTVAMDSDGDFIITWSGVGRDGSGWGVFAQQYDNTGAKRGGEFRVNTTTAGDQQFSSVAMDANGDYVIVWTSANQDGSGNGVYGQRYAGGNDAPVNVVPPAQAVDEDAILTFSTGNGNAIAVGDVDAGSALVQIVLAATNGTLTLSGTSGLTFTTGDGSGDATMTFTGTLADINNALQGMTFSPTANYNGPATVSITSNDLGNTGWDAAQSDSDTVNVTVNAVNDAPANSVPGAQTIAEDTTLVFSTGNGNRILVADLDLASGLLRVTLSATKGVLTLSGVAGLGFTTGDGIADATMTFTGTLASINAALDGLGFTPDANYNGAASVQITSNDQGNTGAGGALLDTDAVAVTINSINDAPVNTVPVAQVTDEDVPLVFSTGNGNLIAVADVDAAGSLLRVTLTATNGTLTLSGTSGLSFTTGDGAGDGTMTFTGTLTDINAALEGLTFNALANFNGAASVQITTNDQGNTGAGGALADSDAIAVTVNSINDAPVNTVPPAQSTAEDTPLIFSAGNGNRISIGDVDANGNSVRVTLSASNGSLTLASTSGLTFTTGDGSGDGTMTFTGTVADINAALDGLTYSPNANFNGAASVQITTHDLGNTGSPGALSDTDNVAVTVTAVNDAPVLSGGNDLPTIDEDDVTSTGILVSGLIAGQVTDADAGALFGVAVTAVDNTNGTWQYTTDGSTWLNFGTPSAAAARLLAADANTRVRFVPAAHFNGAIAPGLTFRAWDRTAGAAGGTANVTPNGGSTPFSAATATSNVTVNAFNDAPVNTVPPAQATDEDTPLVFSAGNGNLISIADVDANGNVVRVTLAVTTGALTLSGTTGLSFLSGDGSGDATMTFTGTIADINAAMEGLTFSPPANYNGGATLQITTSDLANTGAGGTLSDTDSVAIAVNAVNDAPVNTVPPAQAIDEDETLVFSAGNGNAISIFDLDAGSSVVRVTLTAADGLLTLGGTGGLTFTTGDGSADGTMTFTGTVADINAALEGMSFSPDANFNGSATVTLATSDLGNAGAGGAQTDTDAITVNVAAVNDGPVNNVPPAQATDEDTDLVFSAGNGNLISVTDLDAASGLIRLTLSVTNGTLTLSGIAGLTFSTGDGSGDAAMAFTGTLADVNAALDGMTFAPALNYNGPAVLSITTSDQANTGSGGALSDTDSVALTVNAVNDAPVHVVPGPQTTDEDVPLIFSPGNGNAISVSDVDAVGDLLSVTLSATNGTLTLSGIAGLSFTTGDGSGDATMVFTGTLADINAALNGLSFRPALNYDGPATVTITTDDQGSTGAGGAQADSDTIGVTVSPVNDPPTSTVPPPQSTDEDTPLVFSTGGGNGIFVFDPDSGSKPIEVVVTATNGTLTLGGTTGLTFTTGDGTGDATMVFRGKLDDINAALEGLIFSPAAHFNGTATVQVSVNDQGHSGSGAPLFDTKTVSVTVNPVNDAPVINLPPPQATDEDTDLVFSTGNGNVVSIADVDSASGLLQLTVSVTNGTLTLSGVAGLSFTTGDGSGDATMTFTGTLSAINAALDGMRFSPAAHYNGAAALSLAVSDQGNTGQGGALADARVLALTVNAVNDAPANTVPPAQVIAEDQTLVFSAGNNNRISIADLDADPGHVRVTLSVTNGTLTLFDTTGLLFATGDGNDDATMTFTGSVADINAALNGMAFAPNLNFNGTAVLSLTTDDQGNSGAGGAQAASSAVTIHVNAVNDGPTQVVPPAQATDEDTPLIFSPGAGNGIVIGDVDAATVRVTLAVSHGTLTLATLAGLTFTAGDGAGDATVTFTGSIAAVNAALDGLRFDPAAHYFGPAALTVTTSDQGSTGAGGAKTATSTVAIAVNSVNDVPVIQLPPDQSISEDGTLVLSASTGNGIRLTDVDAGNGSIRVILAAANGTLTLGQIAGLSFEAGDGSGDATMTFTGSIDAVNAALEALRFAPDADYFGPASLNVIVNDRGHSGAGGAQSANATLGITVNPVNDPPVLNASPGSADYVENGAGTIVDPGITLADVDNSGLTGATVTILNYVAGEDVLSFIEQSGITGSFDAATGVLTLTGNASVNAYRAALRSVAYTNTSDNPSGEPRAVRFAVSDGASWSNPADRAVNVHSVNDAPTAVDPSDPALILTLQEDAGRSVVDLWKLFNDIEDPDGDLVLTVEGNSNDKLFGRVTIDPATGQLVLDSAADAFGSGTITVRATDKGGKSVDATLNVTVENVNDAPIVVATPGTQIFVEQVPGAGVLVDPALELRDVDSPTLTGAVVRITDGIADQDVLTFTAAHGITGSYDAATATLTLAGEATLAQYREVLRSVRYGNVTARPARGERHVRFSVTDDAGAVSGAAERAIGFPSQGTVEQPPPPPPPPPPPEEPPPTETPVTRPPTHRPKPPAQRPPLPEIHGGDEGPQRPPAPPVPVVA